MYLNFTLYIAYLIHDKFPILKICILMIYFRIIYTYLIFY